MSRSKFKSRSRRRVKFKDREHVLADFKSHVSAYEANPEYLKILVLLGMGGSGKSRLLDKLSSEVENRTTKLIRVTLESEASYSAVAPLKAIRDQIPFDCFLFDVALLRFWSASGQIHSLDEKTRLSNNFVLKLAEVGSSLTGIISLPVTFAAELYEKIKGQYSKHTQYSRQEFVEIDELRSSSDALIERLPFYLGSDIERRLTGSKDRYIFLYDSYEKQKKDTQKLNSPWLREFIGSLDLGIHVIASREKLEWPENDWADVIAPTYILDQLPERDVREIFIEECDPSPEILDKMVASSRRIPFYIELLVNAYLDEHSRSGKVTIDKLPSNHADAVSRFIDHFDDSMQTLVIALSAVQFFDQGLILGLVRNLNLSVDLITANEVCEMFFVELVDSSNGIYKTHDLLTDFIRNETSFAAVLERTVTEAAAVMALRTLAGTASAAHLPIFLGLSEGADMHFSTAKFVENMLDFGYALYDAGFWRELANVRKQAFSDNLTSGAVIRHYFAAISHRRLVSVKLGLRGLKQFAPHRSKLGRHELSLDLETAYLIELSGDYDGAKTTIDEIFQSCSPHDPNQRTHFRALLYHADFLTMDGGFELGDDVLLAASERIDPSKRLDWAELVRHRAHAHRFSFLFEEAEALYLKALDACDDTASMVGKLKTNLAETRCWTAPHLAIENARKAIEINEDLGSQIELSKAHGALSIAHISTGDLNLGAENQIKAETLARSVKYPAGILFSKIALCLLQAAHGRTGLVELQGQEVAKLIRQIGTYAHLNCIPAYLISGDAGLQSVCQDFGWIEEETIASRISSAIETVIRSNPVT